MREDFKVRTTKSGRVLVILHPACTISREAILALLGEGAIEEADVLFISPEEIASCDDLNDIPVVIPIDQANVNAPELDAAGRQCGQAGGRVIILFGEGFAYEGLHSIAEKYGTQCGWSARQVDTCIKGPDLAPPITSHGTPVSRPKTDQVKC